MIVVDSSVFASVIVRDEFYEICKGYITSRKATVDLAYAEAANVLWKHAKMGRIPEEEAVERAKLLKRIIATSRVFRSEDLLVDAVRLAVDYDITVYDALFVSLAVKLTAKLVTTDRMLYERLRGTDLEGFFEVITL